jgi:hypothetical protein
LAGFVVGSAAARQGAAALDQDDLDSFNSQMHMPADLTILIKTQKEESIDLWRL